jgi:hypothetical protein
MNSLLPVLLKPNRSDHDIQIVGTCSLLISHVEQCALPNGREYTIIVFAFISAYSRFLIIFESYDSANPVYEIPKTP